jgi:hypothetical protein
MSVALYRTTLIGSTLAWFLLGLHLPGLRHAQQEHHGNISVTVMLAMVVLVVAGIGGLAILFRSPRQA